jgi:two-component system, OmpR family, KDP operon response regulator KdpE
MAHVLLVEDDVRIRTALVRALGERGHAVRSEPAGLPALQAALDDPPDVVVLDLGLPDIDGREWLRMFRGISQVPVVVATARDDEQEIVRTLDAGADDYVVKPFSGAQLDARIRAVLRRGEAPRAAGSVVVGDLTIDEASRVAMLGGAPLELSRLEFDLLAYLARHLGEVVTKRQLLNDVWRQPLGGGDKTIDVHVSWLRRKLGETAAAPRYLHTVRGVGIKLVVPS